MQELWLVGDTFFPKCYNLKTNKRIIQSQWKHVALPDVILDKDCARKSLLYFIFNLNSVSVPHSC